jgi:hypothetical protein
MSWISGCITVDRDIYEHLEKFYFSPLSGCRDLAKSFIADWGYDPAEHEEAVDELDLALCESALETAYTVMREHGLKGPGDAEEATDDE